MTNRLAAHVINRLTDERSFTSVARETNLSVSTVIRVFDKVSYPKARLSYVVVLIEWFFLLKSNAEKTDDLKALSSLNKKMRKTDAG